MGFAEWNILQGNLTNGRNHWARDLGVTEGHPRVQMVGFRSRATRTRAHPRPELVHFRDDSPSTMTRAAVTDLKAASSTST